MKKGLLFAAIAVIVIAGLIYGSDFSGFENMALDPKPGV
jgi:hypothetical protein